MDEDAMVRILMAERLKVLDFIESIVRRSDVADDVYQDVCVLAVKSRQGIQDELHLVKWLRTAARLRSMNVLRKLKDRHLSLDDGILDLLERDWSGHDGDDAAALAEAIRLCVGRLRPHARELAKERYTDGLSYSALSMLLNRPVSSMYTTFARIHAALADCIADRLAREGRPNV